MTSTIPTGQARDTRLQPSKPQELDSPPMLKTQDLGETLPKPFDLPAASRPRMRACGEEWQAVKLAGRAGSDTWREFAEKCLTKHEGAARQLPP